MTTTYLILRNAFNRKPKQNMGEKHLITQDSAFLRREEQNSQGEAVGTGQTYEKQGRSLAETGKCCRKEHRIFHGVVSEVV